MNQRESEAENRKVKMGRFTRNKTLDRNPSQGNQVLANVYFHASHHQVETLSQSQYVSK